MNVFEKNQLLFGEWCEGGFTASGVQGLGDGRRGWRWMQPLARCAVNKTQPPYIQLLLLSVWRIGDSESDLIFARTASMS